MPFKNASSQTLQNEQPKRSEASELVSRACEGELEVKGWHKKRHTFVCLLKMLQARLELAPSYSPDWILSPTRLPIPPLEHRFIFCCHVCSDGIEASTSPLLRRYLIFFVGRVPLEHKFYI